MYRWSKYASGSFGKFSLLNRTARGTAQAASSWRAENQETRAPHVKEISRCDRSQVGVPCDLAGPLASPLGKISFEQRLETPGDPAEQMPAMPALRFFFKHLPILLAQHRQAGPAQLLNLDQHRLIHEYSPLGGR